MASTCKQAPDQPRSEVGDADVIGARRVRTSETGAGLRSADQWGSAWHRPASPLAPLIIFRSHTAHQPHGPRRRMLAHPCTHAMAMTHMRVVSRSTFRRELRTLCARGSTSDHAMPVACPSRPARCPTNPFSPQLLCIVSSRKSQNGSLGIPFLSTNMFRADTPTVRIR